MSDREENTNEENFDYDESGINTPEHQLKEDSFHDDDNREDLDDGQIEADADADPVDADPSDEPATGSDKKAKRNKKKDRQREKDGQKTKVVFITKFNQDVQLSEIKELMGKVSGLEGVFMRSKFSAHVVYKTFEAAEKAVQEFNGKPLLNSPALLCIPSYDTKVFFSHSLYLFHLTHFLFLVHQEQQGWRLQGQRSQQ